MTGPARGTGRCCRPRRGTASACAMSATGWPPASAMTPPAATAPGPRAVSAFRCRCPSSSTPQPVHERNPSIMDKGPLKTLLVDDEPLAIERLQILCSRVPELNLVGTASDGAAALRLAEALKPDLLL